MNPSVLQKKKEHGHFQKTLSYKIWLYYSKVLKLTCAAAGNK